VLLGDDNGIKKHGIARRVPNLRASARSRTMMGAMSDLELAEYLMVAIAIADTSPAWCPVAMRG
jgi:hypothetical protein